MKKLWAKVKQAKWLLWAVLAFAVAAVTWFFRSLFAGHSEPTGVTSLPPVPEKLREKVDKAEEEALKARVEATVKADTEIKELEEIGKIDDGKERRKRLAEKLKGL